MAWEIAAAGTVTLDDVTTPAGVARGQLGGSAVYFALAAARLVRVHLVGVVGRDGEVALRAALRGSEVDLASVDVVGGPTFRWRARHDFDAWVAVEESAVEGVGAGWRPRLDTDAAAAPVLFAGSMRPEQQLAVLDASSARLVASDTMTTHIATSRGAVRAVTERSDVLFVNRTELAALTETPVTAWRRAAQRLCGVGRLRGVVVKAGPEGAAMVTADAVVERAAHPVAAVIDPTGAGDALAGGMLGACAQRRSLDVATLVDCLDAGLASAAACVGAFGVAGLRNS